MTTWVASPASCDWTPAQDAYIRRLLSAIMELQQELEKLKAGMQENIHG